jgi:hypothetical protein
MFDVTREERDYLVTVLEHAHKELLHELHHTDNRQFRQMLRRLLHVNEDVTRRIRAEGHVAA